MEVARKHRRNDSLLLNGFCGYVKKTTGRHQSSRFTYSIPLAMPPRQ